MTATPPSRNGTNGAHRNGSNGSHSNGSEDDKSKGGRPTKYSEAAVEKLCEALADGVPQRGACVHAGISESTLLEWKKQYPDLQERMDKAREAARREALRGIKGAADRDWRAHAKWLEMTFPADYRGSRVEVNANANATVYQQVSLERQEELRERMRKALER